MLAVVSLTAALLGSAYSAPSELPAGVSAAECVNYPFCGPDPVALELRAIPGFAEHENAVKALEQQHRDIAERQKLAAVPGFAEHQAAEARVLATHGILPVGVRADEAFVLQAEQQLIALQLQQAHQQAAQPEAFVGLVGPSGSIGPSGAVGPSGVIAF